MKVTSTKISDHEVELQITAPADRVHDAITYVDIQVALQSGLNPFETTGTSAMLRETMGDADYNSFIDSEVMRYLAHFAVSQEKISIMGAPKVESLGASVEPGKGLSFKATVLLRPQYEIDDFSPVKITIQKPQISEHEIEQQLLMMAEEQAVYQPIEGRSAQYGDDVFFSITTVNSKGDEVPYLTFERRAYKIGQRYLPGGFDEELLGMEVGQTKTFTIKLDDYNPENPDKPLKAESYTFTVTFLELNEYILPDINDSWVKENIPGLSSVSELREDIRRQGNEYKQAELEKTKRYAAATAFAKRFKGKIADEYYELTRDEILNGMRQSLEEQGSSLEEFIDEQPGGEQQFYTLLMMQAREMLVNDFSLDALACHLKIKVTEEDIEETFQLMAPGFEKEARMEFEMTGQMYVIQEGAKRNKANKWLVETAEIEYID